MFGIFWFKYSGLYLKKNSDMNKSSLPKEAYEQYYATYLSQLDDNDLMVLLKSGKTEFTKFIEGIEADKLKIAYSKDKWTIAEVILHVIDAERVFQYRALRFLRNDKTTLPGFDQDQYVLNSNANIRSRKSLITEFGTVRDASITLFQSLGNDDLMRKGIASNIEWTVATLGFVICGHLKHHQNILSSRYLVVSQ